MPTNAAHSRMLRMTSASLKPNNPSARGVSEIPKLADDWDELSARRGDYALYLKKWSRLPACPFCNDVLPSQDGRRRSTIGLRRFSEGRDERLAHFCFNKGCTWNLEHGARARPHPLPIHIMDSDIYAHTPSVLLGTVDKLALIGQSARTIARVLGMFGFPAWHHAATGRVVSPHATTVVGQTRKYSLRADDVRSTPGSGLKSDIAPCSLCAKSGPRDRIA